MNHYDALLAELRAIDKKLLRKLDHKRRPPESMPVEIWYGSEITRDLLDKVLDYGGYSEIEGTPLVLCRYTYYSDPFRTYLFTTVGVYTTQMDLEYSNHRFRYLTIECPLRYDEFRKADYVKSHGYIMENVDVIKQDGTADQVRCNSGQVYFATAFIRCVDYVNRHGHVEAKPLRIPKLEVELLESVQSKYFSGKVLPLFEPRTTLTPEPLPEPVEPQKAKPQGSGVYSKAAAAKMEEFRRWAKKSEPEKALRCLREAADLGHGDALWILTKIAESEEDMNAMVSLSHEAVAHGSQEAADMVEVLLFAGASVSLTQRKDPDAWLDAALTAAKMGSAAAPEYIAEFFLTGTDCLKPNRAYGLRMLEIAADLGSVSAMYKLATAFLEEETQKSVQLGKYWLTKAAENGNVNAMRGLMSTKWCESKQDWETARYWGRQAFAAVGSDTDRSIISLGMLTLAANEPEYTLWLSVLQSCMAGQPQDNGKETS